MLVQNVEMLAIYKYFDFVMTILYFSSFLFIPSIICLFEYFLMLLFLMLFFLEIHASLRKWFDFIKTNILYIFIIQSQSVFALTP
jgi:hypothetical protein